MIKIVQAHTFEIDDVDAAVDEILHQLTGQPLLKNSVGLVACFSDFLGSGVVSALAEKLPFPLAGATTLAASANGISGDTILTLTVLTSDDVEFVAGMTGAINGEDEAPLREAWEKTGGKRQDKAALMIGFAPLLFNVSGDFFVESWSGITGNVPIFGTLAVDHNDDYHEAQAIYGGEGFRDRFIFVLCYGKLEPRFFFGGIFQEKVFREKGVVTSSQGNQLKGVNGVSVGDYLSSLGLTRDETGNIVGINSFPFILDYNDGTQPVIRVMFAITPDGSAVCGGKIPEGATLTVGNVNAEEVMRTSTDALLKALESCRGKSMLIFSCVGRYFSLGFKAFMEMEKAEELLKETPFSFSYSGTELCPVYDKDGKLTNRSHNDTIVICAL
ncbi:MAG: FIST C-terminal domain-containing protein [Treponema sp.]|jgi:hypothetical protein|nr:FIST C-terminal domain-containing protein [Treponema sp.]